ncbi:hypothetical protein [Antribacter gilvus]|uniref:hypothetical protein n=1 Tax=Antribacter gilvus TaxID=2304675 RepID=UPI0013DEB496|nr:hypothetical protein [Antribacter gilvus]
MFLHEWPGLPTTLVNADQSIYQATVPGTFTSVAKGNPIREVTADSFEEAL